MKDIVSTAPVGIVSLGVLVVLTIEALKRGSEKLNCRISILVLAVAGWMAYAGIPDAGTAFSGMVSTGGFANYLALLFCVSGILVLMISESYLEKHSLVHGEYYVLLLSAIAGMMLMASAADLMIFFLGLELMSVCFYVMAGFARGRLTSNEAALKYFLLGAFATGFLLYGIALVYGASGTTELTGIIAHVKTRGIQPLMAAGLGLLLIGLAFKVAAVPFHMWVPDVYEGSPTTVTAFMSTAGKAAAFASLLLIMYPIIQLGPSSLGRVLSVIAALSMIIGNVLAISQSNIKRMLAYSSIAHAGYMLVGVVAGNALGGQGVLFYLAAYAVVNVGAFAILSMLETENGGNLMFDDYIGFSKRNPLLAGLMAIFMFSLTGIPPFAGFLGKYYVFAGAVEAGYTWLAIIGVVMSVVSAYYYLRLVTLMYFQESESSSHHSGSKLALAAVVFSALVVVAFGVYPALILDLTSGLF